VAKTKGSARCLGTGSMGRWDLVYFYILLAGRKMFPIIQAESWRNVAVYRWKFWPNFSAGAISSTASFRHATTHADAYN
jgi:hypothetical protein